MTDPSICLLEFPCDFHPRGTNLELELIRIPTLSSRTRKLITYRQIARKNVFISYDFMGNTSIMCHLKFAKWQHVVHSGFFVKETCWFLYTICMFYAFVIRGLHGGFHGIGGQGSTLLLIITLCPLLISLVHSPAVGFESVQFVFIRFVTTYGGWCTIIYKLLCSFFYVFMCQSSLH